MTVANPANLANPYALTHYAQLLRLEQENGRGTLYYRSLQSSIIYMYRDCRVCKVCNGCGAPANPSKDCNPLQGKGNEAMKAIETQYKGYRFRSRLEARWAVFFDTMGIRWEYEKEGFELRDGTRYLPDFWLPDHKSWIEIKPTRPKRNDEEWKKAHLLAEYGYPAGLVAGSPGSEHITFFVHDLTVSSGGGPGDTCAWWWPLDSDTRVTWKLEMMQRSDRSICNANFSEYFDHFEWPREYRKSERRLSAAYKAARSARFEFGESGAP